MSTCLVAIWLAAGCQNQLAPLEPVGSSCELASDPDGGPVSGSMSGPGAFTPSSQLAFSRADPSVQLMILSALDQGAIACTSQPNDGGLGYSGRSLGLFLHNADGASLPLGAYGIVDAGDNLLAVDGGLVSNVELIVDTPAGISTLTYAGTGTVTLTQLQPTLAGSFDLQMNDAYGAAVGTLCGAFDAEICGVP